MTRSEPVWLDSRAVVLIHQRQLAEHGGRSGGRDTAMFASALAAPRQIFFYRDTDLYELAACYGVRLAKNHPFVDGNKRTAWVCTRLFLRLNGLDVRASAADKIRVMLQVASNEIDQAGFSTWLRERGEVVAAPRDH